MATATLTTKTEYSIVGSAIGIRTFYVTDFPQLRSFFVSNEVGNFNGASYEEGELIGQWDTSSANVYIDTNGNLFIDVDDPENYSIDEQTGDLIYNDGS